MCHVLATIAPVQVGATPSMTSYTMTGPPSLGGSMVRDPSQLPPASNHSAGSVDGATGEGRRCQCIKSRDTTWSQWFWQHWWNTWNTSPCLTTADTSLIGACADTPRMFGSAIRIVQCLDFCVVALPCAPTTGKQVTPRGHTDNNDRESRSYRYWLRRGAASLTIRSSVG